MEIGSAKGRLPKNCLPCSAKWAQHGRGKAPEANRKQVERDSSLEAWHYWEKEGNRAGSSGKFCA